ncbi:MAG: flagellar protein FliT [Methylobacter sp.]|nr:flagellar protein FliT [Methylobacter sp.]
MTDKITDLQQLVSLSREMLEKAESESWDELFVLEEKRRALLGLFFSVPVQQEYAGEVSEGIQSIMAIDRNIMELGLGKKLELEQALHQIDQGKKAVKAYNS